MKVYCSECKHFRPKGNSYFEAYMTDRYKDECHAPNNLGTWRDRNEPKNDPWNKNYYGSCNWYEKRPKTVRDGEK